MPMKKTNRYNDIIEKVFRNHYKKGLTEFEFKREEIERVAAEFKIKLPKNIGDLIYSFRFRAPLPDSITDTATRRREWIIKLAGRAKYKFCLARINRILPSEGAY